MICPSCSDDEHGSQIHTGKPKKGIQFEPAPYHTAPCHVSREHVRNRTSGQYSRHDAGSHQRPYISDLKSTHPLLYLTSTNPLRVVPFGSALSFNCLLGAQPVLHHVQTPIWCSPLCSLACLLHIQPLLLRCKPGPPAKSPLESWLHRNNGCVLPNRSYAMSAAHPRIAEPCTPILP